MDLYNLFRLMRKADATETIATNYHKRKADSETYERWYNKEAQKVRKQEPSITSLRSVLTRMKSKKVRQANSL